MRSGGAAEEINKFCSCFKDIGVCGDGSGGPDDVKKCASDCLNYLGDKFQGKLVDAVCTPMEGTPNLIRVNARTNICLIFIFEIFNFRISRRENDNIIKICLLV